MIVGFTGSRKGVSLKRQIALVKYLQEEYKTIKEFHFGDCIGADTVAFQIFQLFGIKTICHPPKNPALRAWNKADVTLPEKDYLDRNHDIVDACDLLIAMPENPEKKEQRSGTWATIRYAEKKRKKIYIV